MRCKICDRKSEDEYCDYHGKAYSNIERKFEKWSRALGLSWEEYLREIIRNEYTGIWAKEVADYLLSDKQT